MNSKFLCWLLTTVSLTTAPFAGAQQAGEMLRIGFLDGGTASGMAGLLKAFLQELSKLGWIEGKISPSSTDSRRESLSADLSLRWTWFV